MPRITFDLRALLLFVTIVCVLGGIYSRMRSIYLHRVQRQTAAVTALRGLGCRIRYDYPPAWLRWFAERFGPDTVHNVRAVLANDLILTDDDLAWLDSFPKLETLRFFHVRVSDRGMQYISRLGHLRKLVLHNAALTDDELRHLQSLHRLELLGLANNDVSSRGIEYLSGHQQLKVVFLQNTRVNDEGLKTIGTWPQLSQLTLDGNDITSDGVRHLRGTTFYHLSLDNTRVGDKVFANMPPLEWSGSVSLDGTLVTEPAVKEFEDVTEAAVYSDFYCQ